MTNVVFAEGFKTEPYWWDATPRPVIAATELPQKIDVVVIGSGYTGLHAALQTARGGRSTLVLDAEDAGFGCSTRNGGQISTSIKPGLAKLTKQFGEQRGRAILRDGHDALAWIERFVAEENIDCDFKVVGRFHAAHNEPAFSRLVTDLQNEPADFKSGGHVVPRAEQRTEIGTDAYFGGILYPRHASIDAGRYHQGLLSRVLEAGATVATHCPAQAIERSGKEFRITTPKGVVMARDVVIATNGYTSTITPWQRRRVIPIGSYMIATEAFSPELMDRLMPRNRIVSDTRKVVYYYRASPDRSRILFGGRVSQSETDPRVSGPLLRDEVVRLFPELSAIRISHSWMGFVAYTFDTLAHSGQHDGMYYAMGYCGSGVSMASYCGMRTGQKILGLKEGRLGFDNIPFQTRPFYTGNPWFLAASVSYYRWRDGLNV